METLLIVEGLGGSGLEGLSYFLDMQVLELLPLNLKSLPQFIVIPFYFISGRENILKFFEFSGYDFGV